MFNDRTSMVAGGLIAAWLLLSTTPAAAQIPRTAGGKPDLSGIWQAVGTAHWDLEDHAPQAPAMYQMGAVGAVPGGRGVVQGGAIPYQPAAAEKKQMNFANRLREDPEIKCYMPGIPRATYLPFPFQIVQTQRDIFMAYEFANADRKINMGEPTEFPYGTWMGWSNGRWDGDTLVVDVTGFNDKTWLAGVGSVHSEQLHVTERYTRDTYDTIRYQVTMEDPVVFTKPWHMEETFRLRPNERIREYECIEANEDIVRFEELLQSDPLYRKTE